MKDIDKAKILEQAIEIAKANGWNQSDIWKRWQFDSLVHGSSVMHQYDILYSHDFAKALWGEEEVSVELPNDYWLVAVDMSGNDNTYMLASWQYHLQQMVIAEEPIKYLGDNLPG